MTTRTCPAGGGTIVRRRGTEVAFNGQVRLEAAQPGDIGLRGAEAGMVVGVPGLSASG